MVKAPDAQGILTKTVVDDGLRTCRNAFMIDWKAHGVTNGMNQSSSGKIHKRRASINGSDVNRNHSIC